MCSHQSPNDTGNALSYLFWRVLLICQGTYSRFNIQVEALQIDQADLNTKRMLDLMAVGQENGSLPLYMHTVQRIFREMRIKQQSLGTGFDYAEFKRRILDSGLIPGQLEPLKQRLDTSESFMAPQQAFHRAGKKIKAKRWGSSWTPRVRDSYSTLCMRMMHHWLNRPAESTDYS